MTRGDFSRFSFDAARQYSAVVMQQGRMQLDADWNEQQAILAHRLGVTFRDLIGPSAAPNGRPGFGVGVHRGVLFSGRGDHLRVDVPIGTQPLRLGSSFDVAMTLSLDVQWSGGGVVAYVGTSAGLTLFSLRVTDARTLVCTYSIPDASPSPDVSAVVESIIPMSPGISHRVNVRVRRSEVLALLVDGTLVGVGAIGASSDQAQLPVRTGGSSPAGDVIDVLTFGAAPLVEGKAAPLELSGGFYGAIDDIRLTTSGAAPAAGDARHLELCEVLGAWALSEGSGVVAHDRGAHEMAASMVAAPDLTMPTWGKEEIRVGEGRFYVDGLLVENSAAFALNGDDVASGSMSWPPPDGPGRFAVSLVVTEQSVNAALDPTIAEVALGGADTAVRLRTVAQVRLDRVDEPDGSIAHSPTGSLFHVASVTAMTETNRLSHHSRARAGFVSAFAPERNRLHRVEIHQSGPGPLAARAAIADVAAGTVVFRESPGTSWRPGDLVHVRVAESLAVSVACVTSWDVATKTLRLDELPADVIRRGAAEILPLATAKWSAENASLVAPVERATTTPSGSRHRTTFVLRQWATLAGNVALGDWVELVTERSQRIALPNPLLRIVGIDLAAMSVVAEGPVGQSYDVDSDGAASLVRWDGPGTFPVSAEVTLGQGLEVQFDPHGVYEEGQYWLCLARVLGGGLMWPQVNGVPMMVPAQGPTRARSLLAVLEWDGRTTTVVDFRRFFGPVAATSHSLDAISQASRVGLLDALDYGGADLVGSALGGGVGLTSAAEQDDDTDELESDLGVGGAEVFSSNESGSTSGSQVVLGFDEPPKGYLETGLVLDTTPECFGWRVMPDLPASIGDESHMVTIEDRVFVLTSSGGFWELTGGIWARDPSSDFVALRGSAVVGGDRIHVIGGQQGDRPSGRHLIWSPASALWEEAAPMLTPRCYAAAAAFEGRIHVFGGRTAKWRTSALHEVYDPEMGWSSLPPGPVARHSGALFDVGGRLLHVGGARTVLFFLQVASRRVDWYDPSVHRWSSPAVFSRARRRQQLPRARQGFGASSVASIAYVLGGRGRLRISSRRVFRFNPSTCRWDFVEPLRHRSPSPAAAGGHSEVLHAPATQRHRGHESTPVDALSVARPIRIYRHMSNEPLLHPNNETSSP